ncbi:tRNA 2-thiocytidine biosynthesis TtcA family protein [Clostridium sp. WILCCON 0269]|uniref:tRNA 2-thiocytidine biosynthesis TtcA family protein n=1 Tax=Candidatus Clostridium eludens TaxID=3381663 RepID=A0ABW8SF30_9CLOT
MDKINGTKGEILVPFNEAKPLKEIEHSITKRYRKRIWSKFVKAISEFNLVEEGDRVAVAVSGGKDSMLMAKLFQQINRRWKVNFQLEFISMDPGYDENNRELLISNCKYLDIPVHIFESNIFRVADNIAKNYPCYICARMRRGALYSKAQQLGCNKLALGHHFNDVIETTLLNLLYGGSFKTMLPKLKSENFENMELIRPLYFVHEADIEAFTKNAAIQPLNCACVVTKKRAGSKRYEIKDMIKEMKKNFKDIDKSIFHAARNVNLDGVLGWEKDGEYYSYLEFYNGEK